MPDPPVVQFSMEKNADYIFQLAAEKPDDPDAVAD
jgi:hypothetical protein